MEVDYEDYFEVCRISSCAYTFKEANQRGAGVVDSRPPWRYQHRDGLRSQALYILLKFLIIQKNKSRKADDDENEKERPAPETAFNPA